jgi:hypothetical protein
MLRRVRALDRLHVQEQRACGQSAHAPTHQQRGADAPSCSRTVAYRLLASGQDWRVQSPLTLYSFRQKFCVVVLRAA